jgi:hypothetical protein
MTMVVMVMVVMVIVVVVMGAMVVTAGIMYCLIFITVFEAMVNPILMMRGGITCLAG